MSDKRAKKELKRKQKKREQAKKMNVDQYKKMINDHRHQGAKVIMLCDDKEDLKVAMEHITEGAEYIWLNLDMGANVVPMILENDSGLDIEPRGVVVVKTITGKYAYIKLFEDGITKTNIISKVGDILEPLYQEKHEEINKFMTMQEFELVGESENEGK